MILDEWGVKDHCVECGFPCRKSACVHYDAGVEIQCDACGKTWTVEAGSYLRDHDTHLCDACMKTAVRKHAMAGKQPYTILINVPDAVDSDRPIYIVHVNATNMRHAWVAAVLALIADLEVDVRDLQDEDEDRFRCVALFHGHHKNFANLIEKG